MHTQSKAKLFTAMYCDIILFDAFIRARDFFASGKLSESRNVLVWIAAGLCVYLFNRIYFAKERTVTNAVIVNVVIGIPEMILLYRLYGPYVGLWSRLFLITGVIAVHGRLVNRFFEPVTIDSSIRFLEMSVFGYLVFIAYQNYSHIGGGISMMIFSSIIVSLAGVMLGRLEGAGNTDSGAGHRGLVLVGSIIGAVSAGCVLFGVFFSDAAGHAVTGLVALLLMLAKTLGTGAFAVLNFLISLFPAGEAGPVELPEPQSLNIPGEMEMVQTNDGLFRILVAAGAVLLVLGLIFVLWQMRKARLGSVKLSASAIGSSRSKFNLLEYAKKFFVGMITGVKQSWKKFRIRNTVPGLAVYIGDLVRKGELQKAEHESYGAYLRRLAVRVRMDTDGAAGREESLVELAGAKKVPDSDKLSANAQRLQLAVDLEELAAQFDCMFYSDHEVEAYPAQKAAGLRLEIKKYIDVQETVR